HEEGGLADRLFGSSQRNCQGFHGQWVSGKGTNDDETSNRAMEARDSRGLSVALVADRETGVGGVSRRLGRGGDRAEVLAQRRLHRREECLETRLLALGNDLDPPVVQVSDVSADLKIPGKSLAGESKPHALDPARVVNPASFRRHGNPVTPCAA